MRKTLNKYFVISAVMSGDERFNKGDEIELSEEDAAALLGLGSIAEMPADEKITPPKKTIKGKKLPFETPHAYMTSLVEAKISKAPTIMAIEENTGVKMKAVERDEIWKEVQLPAPTSEPSEEPSPEASSEPPSEQSSETEASSGE
jgi:hypothetical protein